MVTVMSLVQQHSAQHAVHRTHNVVVPTGCFIFQAVEKLIESGAALDIRGMDGMTPLGIAAFWGYADIVKCLLKNG